MNGNIEYNSHVLIRAKSTKNLEMREPLEKYSSKRFERTGKRLGGLNSRFEKSLDH